MNTRTITHPFAVDPVLIVGTLGTVVAVEMTVGTETTLPDEVICTVVVTLILLVDNGEPPPPFLTLVDTDRVGALGPLN